MTLDPETRLDAAEYALRLADADAARALLSAAATDAELRQEISRWEIAFSPLLDEVQEVAPRAAVRRGINARLFGRRRPAWRRMLPWLTAGAAATALAITLLLPVTDTSGPGGSLIVAEIATEGDALRVLAAYDATAGGFRINRIAGAAPVGSDYELWAIGSAGVPVSLGLLPENGVAALPEPMREEVADLTLAVSLEPAGGSPDGAPTQVLAAAPVSSL